MKISIVFEEPPLIDEIDRVFHIKGKPVIFAWGDIIFNPQRNNIPAALVAHEIVHCRRQGGSHQQILDWWRRYLYDPAFRLAEEIPAHQAEYQSLISGASRQVRRMALKQTAKRLAAPLYGRMVSPAKAKALILESDRAEVVR